MSDDSRGDFKTNKKGAANNESDELAGDVEALLRDARARLERLCPGGLVSSGKFGAAGDGPMGVKGRSPRGPHEGQWRRLFYLEWLLRFVAAQQQTHEARGKQVSDVVPTPSSERYSEENESHVGSNCASRMLLSVKGTNELCGLCSDVAPCPVATRTLMSATRAATDGGGANDAENLETRPVSTATEEVDVATPTVNGTVECVVQREEKETNAKWRHFRTWHPPPISIFINQRQPYGSAVHPERHILCLCTVLHEKPRGRKAKNKVLVDQGLYCKKCLCPLHKQKFPVSLLEKPRFCYYTGMYYCRTCHSGRTCAIPARVLHAWDFEPRPVCNDVMDFLEVQRERPLYCVSAVNPALYERVVLLEMVRFLRRQVIALREVGIQCPVFRRLFYGNDATDACALSCESTTGSSTALGGAGDELFTECFVPQGKRYLMEDSEIWSFFDFEDVHRSRSKEMETAIVSAVDLHVMAGSHASATASGGCGVMTFLKRLRSNMARHILQSGCDTCLRNSFHVCHWCCPAELALKFEHSHQRQKEAVPQTQELGTGPLTPSPCLGIAPNVSSVLFPPDQNMAHLFTVYSFDLLHVRECFACGACYHTKCFDEMRCKLGGGLHCLCCQRAGNNDQ